MQFLGKNTCKKHLILLIVRSLSLNKNYNDFKIAVCKGGSIENLVQVATKIALCIILISAFLLIDKYHHFYLILPFVVYIFVLDYDIEYREKKYQLYIFAILFFIIILKTYYNINFLISNLLALMLGVYNMRMAKFQRSMIVYDDERRELKYRFQDEIKSERNDMMESLKNEILSERNRIAREIHDNAGHLISSSILSIGAIKVLNSDEKIATMVDMVDVNLNRAMSEMRKSVHNLYDEIGELKLYLKNLIKAYNFCEVKLFMEFDDILDNDIKLLLIAVIKEALNNAIKHSNATLIQINLSYFDNKYILLIQDNGNVVNEDFELLNSSGIGLKSMCERVSLFHGTFNISVINGFRIFISIPVKSIIEERIL